MMGSVPSFSSSVLKNLWDDDDRDMRADLDRLVARGYKGVVSAETYDEQYFANPTAADAQVMAEYRRAIGA